jgi:regulator of replication initiation timing
LKIDNRSLKKRLDLVVGELEREQNENNRSEIKVGWQMEENERMKRVIEEGDHLDMKNNHFEFELTH